MLLVGHQISRFRIRADFPKPICCCKGEAPKDPPKGDIAVGQTPTGKALRFTYKGSFHQMEDTIYNAIPEYLDEKQLDPSGTFIEEYQTDPVTTPEDKFDIQIFVLLK